MLITKTPKWNSNLRDIREIERKANNKTLDAATKLNTRLGWSIAERNADEINFLSKKHYKLVSKLAKLAKGELRLIGGVYVIKSDSISIDTDITEFHQQRCMSDGVIRWLVDDIRLKLPNVDIEVLGTYHNGLEIRLGDFVIQAIFDSKTPFTFYLDGVEREFFLLLDMIQEEHKEALEELRASFSV
ncbi:hypothetical protein [Vibrio splendidus]|uniref:hypothetical protein n=1 Tax=Vibrio splendidus TaxID=29497 RepID=UPI00080E99A0|nr:hypothetical protein [Vibrio splendidus]OCH61896.1 hypothetical protein A6D94_17125 [Vibrio splendidus]